MGAYVPPPLKDPFGLTLKCPNVIFAVLCSACGYPWCVWIFGGRISKLHLKVKSGLITFPKYAWEWEQCFS